MFHTFVIQVLGLPLTDEVFDQLNTAAYKPHLRLSRNLTPRQWDLVWEKNLPVRDATNLADYDLTDVQLERLLREERRGSVLAPQFYRPNLSSAEQYTILTTAKGSQYVYHALRSPYFDHKHLSTAARHFRGTERIEWCAAHHSISDDEALAAIMYCDTDQGLRSTRNVTEFAEAYTKIITARPQLVPKIFDASAESSYTAGIVQLATSRFLTDRSHQERVIELSTFDYAAMAFVANPVVDIDLVQQFATHRSPEVQDAVNRRLVQYPDAVRTPYDAIEDPATLERLVRRSMPTTRRPQGRPCDLVALAVNPNLTNPMAKMVYAALIRTTSRQAPASLVNAGLDALEARLTQKHPAPRLIESGFWTAVLAQPVSRAEFYWSTERYRLPLEVRSWDEATRLAAYTEIPKEQLDLYRTVEINDWRIQSKDLHAYLVYHLENNPRRWETLCGLAPSHLGSVETLVSAARRLAR